MAIKALNIGTVIKYVCKDDDPKDPTTFHLGVLTSREIMAIRDAATKTSFVAKVGEQKKAGDEQELDVHTALGQMHYEAVRRALKGVDNLLGHDGKPIPWKTLTREIDGQQREIVHPSILDAIPPDTITELAEQVLPQDKAEDLEK